MWVRIRRARPDRYISPIACQLSAGETILAWPALRECGRMDRDGEAARRTCAAYHGDQAGRRNAISWNDSFLTGLGRIDQILQLEFRLLDTISFHRASLVCRVDPSVRFKPSIDLNSVPLDHSILPWFGECKLALDRIRCHHNPPAPSKEKPSGFRNASACGDAPTSHWPERSGRQL